MKIVFLVVKTYSFKSMLMKLLQMYENDPDSRKGRVKFFNAFALAYTYDYVVNKKPYNSAELQARNILFNRWVKNRDNHELSMKQTIHEDYILIGNVIDSIKDDDNFTEKELQIDISDSPGCLGTVIY